MTSYYNELDEYAAAWLRNLISAGLIAPGDVDTRSIVDVRPDDLIGYTQCHFFAGIGGWSYAARLAGWPDDRPLWTGSCPCQPYSVAGKGEGQADARHLWPDFFRLIGARRPDVVMGEQVAAAVGKHWLDGVCADLEGVGYAVGAAVVPACAVDAPHRRDRLWFVADAAHERVDRSGYAGSPGRDELADRRGFALADTSGGRRSEPSEGQGEQPRRAEAERPSDRDVGNTDGLRSAPRLPAPGWRHEGLAEVAHDRSNRRAGPWGECDWLAGADGKARRVEPGIRLLAHGIPARVGKLRAYGNAIVPQAAAEVIGAYMDAVSDRDFRLTGIFA